MIKRYEREAKQRNRESWFLAFIMDTNEEERAKGKTVEVGRAHFATEFKRWRIVIPSRVRLWFMSFIESF